MPRLLLLGLATGLAALAVRAAPDSANPYLPPKSLGPVETYGANIQRSMTLMATSTPVKRNTVRVLFYGQSISADEWTQQLAERLRHRYRFADLVIENRAIGGFYAGRLEKTAEADLYPCYPDLVIFHVHGDAEPYENIIRRIRERTTADILIATDHVAPLLGERMDEETDPARLNVPRPGDHDAAWRSFKFLPALARKYDAELADIRTLWKRYLLDHNLSPSELLRDDLHLNAAGNRLMGAIIEAHLRLRPELPATGWSDRVQTLVVGTDITWKDGRLVVPFEGNRVDLVCQDPASPATPASLKIDGKALSSFTELYMPTRTELVSPRGPLPPLFRVRSTTAPVVETWTLTANRTGPDWTSAKFQVRGSVTGADGEGITGKDFVSNTGRVAIAADDVNFALAMEWSRNPTAATLDARWQVVPLYADAFAVPEKKNPFGETVVTVAQGLTNSRHTLEVTGSPDTPIAAVRVYRPPLGRQ